MRTFTRLGLIATAALLAVGIGTSRANASESNQLTYMTFNTPIALPGIALPPGTYQFKVTGMDHDIVQVFNKSGSKIYTSQIVIPDVRPTPASGTVVTFREQPVGSPEAINSWFYPGRETGSQFIYPKFHRRQIRKG